MKCFSLSLLLFTCLFCSAEVIAADSTCYFYHGLPYGSEKNFHPLTVIVNGGFGIMQIDNRSTKINSIDYRTGAANVWMNITHPFREVRKFGVREFIKTEVIPTKFKTSGAQWFPNYQLHLIGGGMTYRTMYEWYRYHNYPNPGIQAIISLATYHYLNEIVENSGYEGTNMDPIADLLIFDPLSVLLFSFDPVLHFFGNTLHMADWSFQPVITPEGTIENVGQNFNIKIKLPGKNPWSIFYFFGVHGTAGLSYKFKNGKCLSVGGGVVAKDLVDVDPEIREGVKTTTFEWTAGIFYDRNNSLLASLIMAGTKGYKIRLNVYPGLIPAGSYSPGLFCALGKEEEWIFGIHMHNIPVGFGYRF